MFKKLLLPVALLVLLTSGTANADLAIISNIEYDGDSLNISSVKRLFLGERQSFPNGHKAIPVHHASGSPDRKNFFETVLGMSESQHKRHWKRMRASGRGDTPTVLSSYEEIIQWLSETPGGITYIDASKVSDSVKVLLTIEAYENI